MSDPHWTGYVGMITGIIGAITGISGAIIGCISYRKTSSLKALDLRLELRKSENEYRVELASIEDLIEAANTSHQFSFSEAGRSGSGMELIWDKEVASDKTKLADLLSLMPKNSPDYEELNTNQLESKLVDIHKLKYELEKLKEKYKSSIQSDKDGRR